MSTNKPIENKGNECQPIEMEAAVLGSIMSDIRLHDLVFLKFQENIFIKEEHKRIFASCLSIYKNGRLIDSGTVIEQLKSTGDLELAGGAAYVHKLTNRNSSLTKCKVYIHLLDLNYLHRELIRIMTENSQRADEEKKDSH